MRKKQKNNHGVITVMISLMLTGILSLGTMVIEAGRLQGAIAQLDDANLSAGTSMIASYDSTLYERYGLLAIDNTVFNVGRYREYLDFNSDRAVGYKGSNIATFYTVKSAELQGMYNLTYPAVLKRQLLSRAKLHIIPQDYSLNYYNMDYMLSDYQNKATYVANALNGAANGTVARGTVSNIPAAMSTAFGNLYKTFSKTQKYDKDCNVTLKASDMALLPSVTGTVKHSVPEEDIDLINDAVNDANTVIGSGGSLLAANNGSPYGENDVSLDITFASSGINYFSNANQVSQNAVKIASDCRKVVQDVNAAINTLKSDKQGNLLLNSYIAGYFPNKNITVKGYTGNAKETEVKNVNNSNFAAAATEYVFSGKASEWENQQIAYNYIITSRLVANLYSVFTSSTAFNPNNATSVAAHIAWAYYETCADAELLFRYNAVVPMGKYNMILPLNNAAAVNSAFSGGNFVSAMQSLGVINGQTVTVKGYDKTNYRDALAFALWFVPNSKKLLRTADLVQLEMRYKEQHVKKVNAEFLMSEQNTFCRVKCSGSLNSILPVISLGSGGEVNGTNFQSIKYVGY